MKKLVALLLGSALVTSSIVGLAACGPKNQDNPPPPAPPVPEITRRADPRAADAYEAYDYAGAKIGGYKTIADAINATIEADLDFVEDANVKAGAKGGYVLKKGETKHIFDHTKGFAEGNSDCFWYYEDGNKLEAFNCWDNTEGISLLWNNKTVSYGTGTMGSKSTQQYNGFGLLDAHGEEITEDTDGAQPQIYMFSKPMDAGIMAFPGEKVGASGLRYTLDLSKAKIKPAYEGVEDKIYAYFGFYIWQPYYVIATGLACDTTTGQWYPFRGTSRDNSFYDIVYNVDNSTTPVFTSSWNEEGYFVPDAKTVDLEIKTVRGGELPDEGYRVYFEDHLDIVVNKGLEGEKTEKMIIDDDIVQSLAVRNVGADNTFVFIAGLDIKNHDEGESVVPNVDFFNGATFEDFTVTKAEVYFPTEEELAGGTDLNDPLDDAFRGNWYDALMANDDFTEGTWDFTFLYNYTFTTYEKKDGADVYNFRFDGSPVADSTIGGQLKEYQAQVDELKKVTVDNAVQYEGKIEEIRKMYGKDAGHTGSSILQQYYLVIDWTPFDQAVKIYEQALKLSDAGQKVLDDLRTLSSIAAYPYKGWTAPEGATDKKGYLFDELTQFRSIYAAYNALTSNDDKTNIVKLFGEDMWALWTELDADLKGIMDNTALLNKISYNFYAGPAATTKTDMTGFDLVKNVLDWIFTIKVSTADTGFGHDAPDNPYDYGDAGSNGIMNFDNAAYPSLWLCFMVDYLDSVEGFEMPGYFEDLLDDIGYADFYDGLFYPVSENIKLGARIKAGLEITDLTDEDVAFLNEVWTNDYELSGQIAWNWNSGAKFETYYSGRMARLVFMLGEDTKVKTGDYIGAIANFLAGYGYTVKANGWGVTETEISVTPNDSAKAKEVYNAFNALMKLSEYAYKGWEAPQDATDKKGYLYTEVTAFRALAAKYNALTANEKIAVNQHLTRAEYVLWETFSTELKTLEDGEIWKTKYNMFTLPTDSQDKKDYTAAEALGEIIHISDVILANGKLESSGDDAGGVNVCDGDKNFFTSLRLVAFYHFFASNDVTLPDFVLKKVTTVKADEFYTNFFYPLYYTVQLAQRIKTDNVTKAEELTEDELAFLNEVWVGSYTMKAPLSTHYSSQFKWWAGRVPRLVAIAGGTLEGKTLGDYITIVGEFLTSQQYKLNANGWGITGGKIVNVTLKAETAALANRFTTEMMAPSFVEYKGWTAPAGATDKKGYFTDELANFKAILAEYDKLDEGQQGGFLGLVDYKDFDAWSTYASYDYTIDVSKLANVKLTLPINPYGECESKEYNATELIVELYRWAIRISSGTQFNTTTENDEENLHNESDATVPGTACRLGDSNYPSMRMVSIYKTLTAVEGYTLPEFVTDALEACKFNLYLDVYDALVGTAKLALKIEANANLTLKDLTADELAFLNKVWTKDYVINDLIAWNWNTGHKFKDYYNGRTQAILTHGGITNLKELTSDYFDIVGNWLVKLGYTLNSNGWGVTAEKIEAK